METRAETRPKLPELSFRGLTKREASYLFDACAEDMQINCHFGSTRVEVIKPHEPMVKKEDSLPIMTAAPRVRIVPNPLILTFAQD